MSHLEEDRYHRPSNAIDDAPNSVSTYSQLLEELGRLQATITTPADTNCVVPVSIPDVSGISSRVHHQNRLSLLKERYSWVINQISFLARSPLPDPLDAFPQEIWESIISEATFVEIHSITIHNMDHILPLTLVSKRCQGEFE
jgi:hypothetical protein